MKATLYLIRFHNLKRKTIIALNLESALKVLNEEQRKDIKSIGSRQCEISEY